MNADEQWEHVNATFLQVTDQLGKGIDEGILETVIVLNMLGIETTASCEGHPERGTGAPWIDIEARSGYEQRHVSFERLLVIHPRDTTGRARLESQGADFQNVAPLDTRKQKLHVYQEEMQAFTAFLKQRFFSEL